MNISIDMNLAELAERMGGSATINQAREMRECLVYGGFETMDTADVPEKDWLEMLAESVAEVK